MSKPYESYLRGHGSKNDSSEQLRLTGDPNRALDPVRERQQENTSEQGKDIQERRDVLKSIQDSLDICRQIIRDSNMEQRFGDHPGFQNALSDTKKDEERISTIMGDYEKSPGQRNQERKIWEKKVEVDKFVFHKQKDGITGSSSSLYNKWTHKRGYELYTKMGNSSAELTTTVQDQEFRERDWDAKRLKIWHSEVQSRISSLEKIKFGTEETQYESRYLGHLRRLPEPSKWGNRNENRLIEEAIRDAKRQLREPNNSEERIQKICARLPMTELEKIKTRFEKEAKWRQSDNRKANRITTAEELDNTQLTYIIRAAKDELYARASHFKREALDREAGTRGLNREAVDFSGMCESLAVFNQYGRNSDLEYLQKNFKDMEPGNRYDIVIREMSWLLQKDKGREDTYLFGSSKSLWEPLMKADKDMAIEVVNKLSKKAAREFLQDPKEQSAFRSLVEKSSHADILSQSSSAFPDISHNK